MKKDRKRTVEDCLSIDSRTMARSNSLIDGAAGTWVWRNGENEIISSIGYLHQGGVLALQYAIDGQAIQQHIRVTFTPCNYGKHRYWFLCPNHDCGKRIAKLYLANGLFHCRHCHKLNYQIQQCPKRYVAKLNMQRMRIKLGWPLDRDQVPFINKVYKPLNKNQKTFQTMVDKHNEYERQYNATAMALHNAFMGKLDRLTESKYSEVETHERPLKPNLSLTRNKANRSTKKAKQLCPDGD